MVVLRWLGIACMLIGACVLVADSLSGFNEGAFRLKSLGEWWFWADPDSLQLLQPAIERHISPYLFDPYVLTLLEWPASIQFIVLGALLWFFGRSPWRRIEKSRL